MENKKDNNNENAKKITNFLLVFLSGFIQKISAGLVLNAKKQIEEIILKIKKGIFAIFFLLFGLAFLLFGLAIYISSVVEMVAGSGYFIIGLSSLILAFLIIFIKK